MPRRLWSPTYDGRFVRARRSNSTRPTFNTPPSLGYPHRTALTGEPTVNEVQQALGVVLDELQTKLDALVNGRDGWWIETIVNPKAFNGRGITTKKVKEQYL